MRQRSNADVRRRPPLPRRPLRVLAAGWLLAAALRGAGGQVEIQTATARAPEYYAAYLTNDSSFIRRQAVAAIGRFKGAAAPLIPALQRAYYMEDDSTNQATVVLALETIGSESTPVLLSLLDDADFGMRMNIYRALAAVGATDTTVVEKLFVFARRGRTEAQVVGVVLLRSGSQAVPFLVDLLGDEKVWLRDWAGHMIVQLGTESVPGLCVRLRESTDPAECAEIARLLGKIGPPAIEAVPLLKEMAAGASDPVLRGILVRALERIQGNRAGGK